MKLDLVPCPFCGSVNTSLFRFGCDDDHYVRCRDCRASGPEQGSKTAAIEAWRITTFPNHHTFTFGDRVSKKSGSHWHGKVVGFYSTELTPEGYAIESEREQGSVQIYPAKALTPAMEQADE